MFQVRYWHRAWPRHSEPIRSPTEKNRVNEQHTETSLYFRWLSSSLVHSANFVKTRALPVTLVMSRALGELRRASCTIGDSRQVSCAIVNSRAPFLNSSFVPRSLRKNYRKTIDLYFKRLTFLLWTWYFTPTSQVTNSHILVALFKPLS